MLALTFVTCVLTFAPCILTFAIFACGVQLGVWTEIEWHALMQTCCIVHSNSGEAGSDPLYIAVLVGFIFNHGVHVLSGTCGGLKCAGAGPGPQ